MNQEKVGKLLKHLREEKNISQEELSNIINVSRQTLSKWELGKSPIDSTVLIKICKNFKLILDKKYKNDNIFFKKNSCVLGNIEKDEKINNDEVLEYIKNNFVKKDDGLVKEVLISYKKYELVFINESNSLIVSSYQNNKMLEEWNYNFNLNILYYYNYIERFESKYLSLNNVECVQGRCSSKNAYKELFDIIKE